MSHYGAVYENYQDVEYAVARLHAVGVPEDQIQIIRKRDKPLDIFPEGYDPFGGYRFTGTPVATLPASRENLIGNSVTMDISLSMLPDLLAETANSIDKQTKSSSFLVIVDSNRPEVAEILENTGGEVVNPGDFQPKQG